MREGRAPEHGPDGKHSATGTTPGRSTLYRSREPGHSHRGGGRYDDSSQSNPPASRAQARIGQPETRGGIGGRPGGGDRGYDGSALPSGYSKRMAPTNATVPSASGFQATSGRSILSETSRGRPRRFGRGLRSE